MISLEVIYLCFLIVTFVMYIIQVESNKRLKKENQKLKRELYDCLTDNVILKKKLNDKQDN